MVLKLLGWIAIGVALALVVHFALPRLGKQQAIAGTAVFGAIGGCIGGAAGWLVTGRNEGLSLIGAFVGGVLASWARSGRYTRSPGQEREPR